MKSRSSIVRMNRAFIAVLAVAAICALAVACGGDPTPTPTAVPPPTSTPIPQPTPTPTPPPETLDTFALNATATGIDLTDRLSQEEASCIRAELGDEDYEAFQGAPFAKEVDSPYDRPVIERSLMNTLFNCVTSDNVPLLGIAVVDAHAGGWTEETRGCISGIFDENPEIVYVWLGLEREPEPEIRERIGTAYVFALSMWECFVDQEKVDFVLHSWTRGTEGATGEEFMALLRPEEASCLGESLPEDSLDKLRNVSALTEALTIPGAMAAAAVCIDPDINSRLFALAYSKLTGGLSEESMECVLQFSRDYPRFMEVAQATDFDPATLPTEELVVVANDGLHLFGCLNGDELGRYQDSFAERWFRQ